MMTPLLWYTSGIVTRAVSPFWSVIVKVLPLSAAISRPPSAVFSETSAARRRLDRVIERLRSIPAGDHVIGQDLGELRLVLRLQQCVDGACRQRRKGFVGRREDREGAGPLERLHENFAALTAATRVVWSFELTAFSTMFLVGYIGAPPTIGSSAAIAPAPRARTMTAAVLANLRFMPDSSLISALRHRQQGQPPTRRLVQYVAEAGLDAV